jgi:hypothetical protein
MPYKAKCISNLDQLMIILCAGPTARLESPAELLETAMERERLPANYYLGP